MFQSSVHMKTKPYISLLALAGAAFLVSCANPAPRVKVPVSATLRSDGSPAGQVYEAVNAYRRSLGIQELQRHPGLDRLAQKHCEYLRQNRGTFSLKGKNVSHIGFEGRALFARELYRMHNISENVASATGARTHPATAVTALWKGSSDHHKNMTDTWTHTGVGVVVDADGTVFADQLFATVNLSPRVMHDRLTGF